jgi:hypothetical protein
MAHFAKLNELNIVETVIVVDNINLLSQQNIEISAAYTDSTQVTISTITNKAQVLIVRPTANLTLASGTHDTQRITHTFAPTTGSAVVNALTINQSISQSSAATGVTRGLYVNPTLTAAADFRAIETTNGKVIFSGTGSVTISNVLTLTPQSPLPSGVATGSFAVSSSVPPKPYFYDGTTWNALY